MELRIRNRLSDALDNVRSGIMILVLRAGLYECTLRLIWGHARADMSFRRRAVMGLQSPVI